MIQMLTSVIGQRGVDAMAFLLAFALTALTDSIFRDKLPHDHGRAFAVNGELSKGKARGSGWFFGRGLPRGGAGTPRRGGNQPRRAAGHGLHH